MITLVKNAILKYMYKRLSIFISVLVAFILLVSTGIYFYQSKFIIEREIRNQSTLISSYNNESINEFLLKIRKITYLIYKNENISDYLITDNQSKKAYLEQLFLDYCENIELIQAIRIVDVNGDIKIFMRECENLSGNKNFKEINLKSKKFFQKVEKLDQPEIMFSNFERGKLPETTSFCPAMIRTMIPYFKTDKKIGYLVVNFWGEKIGEVLDYLEKSKGYSFLVEFNDNNTSRNGIFLFHPNKYYEFANQFNTKYFLNNIYPHNVVKSLKNDEEGLIKLDNNDFLAYSTVYPYNNYDQAWKICTVLKGSYFFRNINMLRQNFLAVMFFGIFLSVLTSAYLSKKLLSPLTEINKAVKEYSKGNLDYKIAGKFDDELKVIAKTVNNMADSLQQHIKEIDENHKKIEILNRLSSIGFLSAGISHELNTPLNSIIITCNLLSDEVKGDQAEDVATIKNEALRCVEIINALKSLSPQSGKDFHKEKVNLKEVVLKSVKFLKINNDITFKLKLDDGIFVYGDIRLLQLAISNIIMNAVDAVYPAGKINILLYMSEGKNILEISDNGQGMTSEELENIFTPFYTTKSPQSGMGIGLSLVYKIIKEHGAVLKVDSLKNVGTTFTLEFKAYDENSSH